MATTQAVAEVHAPRAIDIFKANFDKAASTILPLLPKHIDHEKFKSMVVTTVAYNPKLQECTPTSLLRAVADAAELGLSLNPNMKECDILPVWSKDGTVAQCRPRYTGLMRLARQSGEIVDIWSHEVYERDEFTYEYGLDKKLIHKPAPGDRGELTFAYCVWKTRDGEKGFEVIDKKRIERAKSSSEGYKAFKAGRIKSTPWADHEEEMWRKTAVRAASKYLPQATENEAFRRALALADDVAFDDDMPKTAAADEAPAIAAPRPTRQAPPAEVKETARKQAYEMDQQYRETMGDEPAASAEDAPQYPTGEMAKNIATTETQANDKESVALRLIMDSKGTVSDFPTIEEWEAAAIYRIDNNKPVFVKELEKANVDLIAEVDAEYPEAVERVRQAFAAKTALRKTNP